MTKIFKRVIGILLAGSISASVFPYQVLADTASSVQRESVLSAGTTVMPQSVESSSPLYYTYTITDGTFCEITGYSGAEANLTIPSEIDGYTVRSIGEGAFLKNLLLETVTLPSTVISVGAQAFAGCTALTTLHLNSGLQEIRYLAFGTCTALASVDIPDSVTAISARAFYNCTSLREIGYPASWTVTPDIYDETGGTDGESYDKSPFDGCTSLTAVTVDDGVTAVPKHAFRGVTALKTITLPASLTAVGAYAFEGCTSIAAAVLPESLSEIGDSAFWHCSSLTSLTIPDTVTVITNRAFSGCTGLTEVNLPDTLQAIEAFAFQNCTSLEEIEIPDSVTSISARAFYNCTSLREIGYPASWTVTPDINNALKLGDGDTYYKSPFDGCIGLKEITVDEGVTAIPKQAFRNMSDLETVNLPSSLSSVGAYAFDSCTGLDMISLPGKVTEIQSGALRNCTGLTYIALPYSLQSLGTGAFWGCTSLMLVDVPPSLAVIGESAFRNCSGLAHINLPPSLTTIGRYTFINCTALEYLIVPDSVSSIADDAFNGASNIVFHCNMTSYAAVYAIDHGIPVVDLEKNSDADALALDRTKSSYKINFDGVSASGSLAMAVNYAFKSPDEISDAKIILNIPDSTLLEESTIRVNNVLCTDYTYADHVLTVPCGNESGTIRFSLRPQSYAKISAYAVAAFNRDTVVRTEVFGSVYAELPLLNISCKTETASADLTVTGITVPSHTVELYVDGVKQTTVTADKSGTYTAKLSLGEPKSGKTYRLSAGITYNGQSINAETATVYLKDIPTLTQFVMEHNGQKFRMDGDSANKPVVFFRPGRTFRFTVKFDHPRSVTDVWIVSSRNNVKKYLGAEWSESAQAFVAEGYFDPENTSYVPGTISVEYLREKNKISFSQEYDFTAEENINEVPADWLNAEITVNENTADVTDITVTLPDDGGQIRVKTRQTAVPAGITAANAEVNGYTKVTDDYGNDAYSRYYVRKSGSTESVIHEFIVYGKDEAFQYCGESLITAAFGSNAGSLFSGTFAAASILDAYKQGSTFGDDYYSMKHTISTLDVSDSRKEQLQNLLNDAIMYNTVTTVLRWAGTAAAVAVGVSLGPVPALAVGICAKAVDMFYDATQRQLSHQLHDLMKELGITCFGFRWAIDPGGYVYDITTGERLAGVTTTVYHIPFDDSGYRDAQPDEDEYGVLWNASEYSQINPLTTDADGNYAWDVPEGWWRVCYQKNGYETAWSEWLAVPPPQTEVNIGMTPIDEKIRGTVTTYTDTEEIILALYSAGTDDTEIHADIMTDERTNALAVSAFTAEDRDENGRYTVDFSFHYATEGSFLLAVWTSGVHSPVILPAELTDEVLTVDPVSLYFLGDLNGDGTADEADHAHLVRYFAGCDADTGYITAVLADINRDGAVTRADAMVFARRLAGWYE